MACTESWSRPGVLNMGAIFSKPKKNKALEASQLRQERMLREKEMNEERDAAARKRAIRNAQSARQRGVQNALQPAGVTRRLGGGS